MPRRTASGKKIKVGVSLHPTLHAWAMARVGPGKEFSTLTHAIERGLAALAEQEAKRNSASSAREEEEPSDASARRRK